MTSSDMTTRLIVEPIVRAALLEDLGRAGDITTEAVVPMEAMVEAVTEARQPGVLAGLDVALLTFELAVLVALAITILAKGAPGGDWHAHVFSPSASPSGFSGVVVGAVFGVLAFTDRPPSKDSPVQKSYHLVRGR